MASWPARHGSHEGYQDRGQGLLHKSSSQALSLLTYSETIWHDKEVLYADCSKAGTLQIVYATIVIREEVLRAAVQMECQACCADTNSH